MTYDDFMSSFHNKILPNKETFIRHGQCLMSYLATVWKEEYVRLSSIHFYDRDDLDCFYRDELIQNTVDHLSKVWVNYPN